MRKLYPHWLSAPLTRYPHEPVELCFNFWYNQRSRIPFQQCEEEECSPGF